MYCDGDGGCDQIDDGFCENDGDGYDNSDDDDDDDFGDNDEYGDDSIMMVQVDIYSISLFKKSTFTQFIEIMYNNAWKKRQKVMIVVVM